MICATTLCEVAGTFDTEAAREERNATMQILQGEALRDDLAKLGLDTGSIGFRSGQEGRRRTVFVAYWKRADG